MASQLTEVAYYSRKLIRYAGICLIFLTVLTVIIFPIANNIYKSLNPPEPLALSSNRPLLPNISFPEIKQYQYSFNFQTANNSLPSFPDRAYVYYISPQVKLGFSTKDQVENTAATFGFTDQYQTLSDYKYQWVRNAPAPLTLIIDAANNYSVDISYQWQNDNTLKSAKLVIDRAALISQALKVLERGNAAMTDIDVSNPQYIYFSDVGNTLDETKSLSEADFVRLDFFKQNIAYNYNDLYVYTDADYQTKFDEVKYEYHVVSDKAKQANIYAVLSGDSSRAQNGIIEAKVSQSNIDYLNPLIYYLKPVKTAKVELENGNAYIASSPADESNSTVTIRRVYLAYYDSSAYQEYLQPIYIFSENELFDTQNPTLKPGFVAYVPAIRVDQVENN